MSHILILASALLIGLFILLLLRYVPLNQDQKHLSKRQIRDLLKFYWPLRVLMGLTLLLYITYSLLLFSPDIFSSLHIELENYKLIKTGAGFLLLISVYWLSILATNVIRSSLSTLPNRNARKLAILMPVFGNGIKATVLMILLENALHIVSIPADWKATCHVLHNLLFILLTSWLLLKLIHGLEALFILQYTPELEENLDSRRTYTHIVIIKRIAVIILSVLTVVAMLAMFENVRIQGKTLFTSAAVLTAFVGFSIQRPLENLARGLQLAITQPIRVNDTVLIEGELGVVDVINLHHVIVTLWDRRQMIVPTNYFIEKPFQNWTHESKDLLGTIFFYIDYKMPINPIRKRFHQYLSKNKLGLWNGHIALLQVTEIKDHTAELRMLVSANDPEKLFDLRCAIRENILEFIQKNHPEGLPRLRIEYPKDHSMVSK